MTASPPQKNHAERLSPPTRRGIVQVQWGPRAFKKFVLTPGEQVVFGRGEGADHVVEDARLSPAHFSIWFSGKRAIVRDLATPNGTYINGDLRPQGTVEHASFIVAGSTTFRLFLESFTPPTDELPTPERLARLDALQKELGPADGALYAVMDAARAERVLRQLEESIDDHQNLYEGLEGRVLDDVAPYLVRFAQGSDLVRRLLLGGWGRGWGVFFRSNEHPKEVRRHLRRFLMVLDDAKHERMYFRFYDPRVMREFYSIATPRQRAELVHGMERMWVENEDETPLVLTPPAGEQRGAS